MVAVERNAVYMDLDSRKKDLPKIYTGVLLICLAALTMLVKSEDPARAWSFVRFALMGAGIFLYLWGRLFSRGEA